MLKIHYEVDEKVFSALVERAVEDRREMFADDLMAALRKSASSVIFGNFMGSGAYSPRAIGEFSSSRSRYYRGWVETKYGSQRARLAAGKRGAAKPTEQAHSLDHLRNTVLVNTVQDLANMNPAYRKVAQDMKAGQPTDNTRGFMRSPLGQKMLARSNQKQVFAPKGEMRYGVQTGKLAKSWRDLRVFQRGSKLEFELVPTLGSTTGTPDARKLASYLTRHNSPGLMDHNQLVNALRDQGILAK